MYFLRSLHTTTLAGQVLRYFPVWGIGTLENVYAMENVLDKPSVSLTLTREHVLYISMCVLSLGGAA